MTPSTLPFIPDARRRWLACLALLMGIAIAIAVTTLAACAMLQPPNRVTLSQSDLQRLLERHFPLDRRLLEVLDVTITAPKLRLNPESNRLATELDVATRDRLFGGRWQGRLALDSALRYEPSDQTIRLAQVRVQDFSIDNAGASVRTQAERLGALLAERVLEDFTVYRVPPERAAQLLRAGVTPGTVTVTSRGVEITLAPISR